MATLAPLTGSNARVTPELFDRMLARGDFDGVHVELFDGTIVFELSQGRLHLLALSQLIEEFASATKLAGLKIATQGTVPMGDDRPEPDFALLAYDPRRTNRPIEAEDVLLTIEVAVTSLTTDRRDKARLYASHGVREYWIVNPVARQIEVFRDPIDERYASLQVFGEDESVEALAIPGHRIRVVDLMPMLNPDEDQP